MWTTAKAGSSKQVIVTTTASAAIPSLAGMTYLRIQRVSDGGMSATDGIEVTLVAPDLETSNAFTITHDEPFEFWFPRGLTSVTTDNDTDATFLFYGSN